MNERTLETAAKILASTSERGVTARVLGGVGVAMCSPSASTPPLSRRYEDLDLITSRRSAHGLATVIGELGFQPEARFNQLHGHSRLLFDIPECHIDVLVGKFVMCHELELTRRLEVRADTLAPADLLLTKLQVAALNEKDVLDMRRF